MKFRIAAPAVPLLLAWICLASAQITSSSAGRASATAQGAQRTLSTSVVSSRVRQTLTPVSSASSPTLSSGLDVFTQTFFSFTTDPIPETFTQIDADGVTSTITTEFLPLGTDAAPQLSFTINSTLFYRPYCWYPVSGQYGILPRSLFYITLGAALFLRSHSQWLFAGALAASLTFSGTAAIHACLLVWRGPGFGELDMMALLAILSTSVILTVPLLNWSDTLRNVGKTDEDIQERKEEDQKNKSSELDQKKQEFDAAARNIVLYWGFLVAVGFICVFVAIAGWFYNKGIGRWDFATVSGIQELTCTPKSGFIDEFSSNVTDPTLLIITKQFIETNGCNNPCPYPVQSRDDPFLLQYERVNPELPQIPVGNALFRVDSDLEPITAGMYDFLFGGVTRLDGNLQRNISFIQLYRRVGFIVVAFMIGQGFFAALFGRRTPAQARNVLYALLTRPRFGRSYLDPVNNVQKYVAKIISASFYAIAVLVYALALPLIVGNITAVELVLAQLPANEPKRHIGEWMPYASVALVVFSGTAAHFHDEITYLVNLAIYKCIWLAKHPSWPFVLLRSSMKRRDAYNQSETKGFKDESDFSDGGDDYQLEAKNIFTGEMESMPDRGLFRTTVQDRSKTALSRPSEVVWGYLKRTTKSSLWAVRQEFVQLREFWHDPDASRKNQGRLHRMHVETCSCVFKCRCRVHDDCRHDRQCKQHSPCDHGKECTHSKDCIRARQITLLRDDRRTVHMALAALHKRKKHDIIKIDISGAPVPVQGDRDPTYEHNALTKHFPWNKPKPEDEAALISQENGDFRLNVPDHAYPTEYSDGQVDLEGGRQVSAAAAAAAEASDKAKGGILVTEKQLHPALRGSQKSKSSASTGMNSGARPSLDAEASRRISMTKALPPVPRKALRVPNPSLNADTQSIDEAVSPVSSTTRNPSISFTNRPSPLTITRSGSKSNGRPPLQGVSVDQTPGKPQIVEVRGRHSEDGSGPAENARNVNRNSRSSDLALTFEQGRADRRRRSNIYSPEASRAPKPAQTSSLQAPIPVHVEEMDDAARSQAAASESKDKGKAPARDAVDEDARSEKSSGASSGMIFTDGQTPSDLAGSMPPDIPGTSFFDARTVDTPEPRQSDSMDEPRTRRQHIVSQFISPPSEPSPRINEMSFFSSSPLLSPKERHELIEPPSGTSTPPINLPVLSPAPPESNAARGFGHNSANLDTKTLVNSDLRAPLSIAGSLDGKSINSIPAGALKSLDAAAAAAVTPPVSDQIQRKKSPRPPGYRSSVSYLQVQRPSTMMFADEIVLRKDENGVYQLVMNGQEQIDYSAE